jgi:hypothetical protein
VGRAYVVIWSYGAMSDKPAAFPEVVIVDRLGPRGWVYGHNPGEERVWAFHLRHAVALTPVASHPAAPPPVDLYRSQN